MKKLSDRWMYYCGLLATFHNVEIDDLKHIQNLIDAEEQGWFYRTHGLWMDVGSLSCRCSVCWCKNNKETKFCPNCGAKMDLKQILKEGAE